jgi:hypothetical protein
MNTDLQIINKHEFALTLPSVLMKEEQSFDEYDHSNAANSENGDKMRLSNSNEVKVFQCAFGNCGKVYTNRSRLEIHERTHVIYIYFNKIFRLAKNHSNANFVQKVLMKKET